MRTRTPNILLATLLCLALLLQAAVPLGFMPDMGALQQGVFKIKICTGLSTKEVYVDQNQKLIPTDQEHKQDQPKKTTAGHTLCPFAGMHDWVLPLLFLALAFLCLKETTTFLLGTSKFSGAVPTAAWPQAPPLPL